MQRKLDAILIEMRALRKECDVLRVNDARQSDEILDMEQILVRGYLEY